MMRRITKRTLLLIIGGWMAFILLWLIDSLKGLLASIVPSLPRWIILLVFLILGLLYTAITVGLDLLKSAPDTSDASSPGKRADMLDLVEKIRIKDFLEDPHFYSFHEELLSLSLHKSGGSRLDLVLSDPFLQTEAISSSTPLVQIFKEAGGELLILGDPGAGKTTLLLELTRDLLKRARQDKTYPIPVVFNLSSWSTKQLPLEQWVIEELKTTYQVATETGRAWVKANQLLLMLDGLDEVAPDALSACIDKINEYYHQAHRSLVVCSRTKEFLDQPGRLALHTAVIVQPLSSQQVFAYLDGIAAKGEDVEGLKQALHQSEDLRKLATTPLLLTVLVLAYHRKPAQELLALVNAAPTDQQHLVFHDYVERMLQRKGTRIHATAQKTKNWLTWLARQLTDHNQTEFYLEYLQPDWLPERQQGRYQRSIWLVVGLVLGLGLMPLAGLGFGLFLGLFLGLLAGLVFGVVMAEPAKTEPAETRSWSWRNALIWLLVGLGLALPGALSGPCYPCAGLFDKLSAVLGDWLLLGVGFFGLGLMLAGGYSPGLSGAPPIPIKPAEARSWSWRNARKGLLIGLGLGLPGGLYAGLIAAPTTAALLYLCILRRGARSVTL